MRPAVRTASLSLDDIKRMEGLFGNVMNAYRQLGLNDSPAVTYAQFYRGMQFSTISPEQKATVEEAWLRWQYVFLRPEVPISSELALSLQNRDILPSWHPDADQEEEE